MKTTLLIGFVILIAAFSLVMAGDEVMRKSEKSTFEGKLTCTSCDLKTAEGARRSLQRMLDVGRGSATS